MPSHPKQPVLLTVLIDTAHFRWYVAGIDLQGNAKPLICSQEGNLSTYLGKELDEQVSFLRHRLAGVLQRGCDRLWGDAMKPCRIVLVTDQLFPQAGPELTPAIAEHFVEWMANPPVTFFVGGFDLNTTTTSPTRCIAGEMPDDQGTAFQTGMAQLVKVIGHEELWEIAPNKPTA